MSNRGSLAEGIIGNSLGKENAGWPSGLKGAGFNTVTRVQIPL